MEPKENFPSDEGPLKPLPDGNTNEKVDRIVNELRSLLANKSITPAEKPAVEKTIPKEPEESLPSAMFIDQFDTSSFPPTFPGGNLPAHQQTNELPSEAPAPLDSGSSLPSDADFWKGNVLGWGEKDEPVPVEDEPIHLLPGGPAPIKIEPVPKGVNPYDIPGLESDASPSESETVAPMKEPAVPPVVKSTAEKIDPEPMMESSNEDSLIHMFPIPPESPGAGDDGEQPGEPAPDVQPSSTQEPHTDTSADLYPDEEKVKPDQLIQVACIVPAGEELKAQAFYRTLKESAAKLPRKFDVQPVFIHDWEPDRIDMVAWEKSASLSGADILFIVIHKSDAETFKPLMKKSAEPKLEKRLIYVEHIPLKNLYSDLLIYLMEKPAWRK